MLNTITPSWVRYRFPFPSTALPLIKLESGEEKLPTNWAQTTNVGVKVGVLVTVGVRVIVGVEVLVKV